MTDSTPKKWTLTILDSGDGTGDGIVTLPDDLIAESGWREGDTLEIETLPDGRVVIYRNLTDEGSGARSSADRAAAAEQMQQFMQQRLQEAEPSGDMDLKKMKDEGRA